MEKPKYDQSWIDAVDEAIRSWEKTRDWNPLGARGPEQCSLCQKTMGISGDNDCHKCPIKHKTGEIGCLATPYAYWNTASETLARQRAVFYANEEVKFLRGLKKWMLEQFEKEVYYKAGQKIWIDSKLAIYLITVADKKCRLFNIETGNIYDFCFISVSDTRKITKEELEFLVGPGTAWGLAERNCQESK